MKTTPIEVDGVDPLFSWYVNILQLKRKYIIFVNDSSRLCLIIDGIRTSQLDKLQTKFKTELKEFMLLEGLERAQINQYFLEAGEMKVSKTNDKSVIGSLNEMSLYSSHMEFENTFHLASRLNKLIYKPIGYERPMDVFKLKLETRYSKG